MIFQLFLSAFLLAFSHFVDAAPVKPVELLAFAPTITSPSGGEVWLAGSQQQVSWKTDNIPTEAENYTLTILLGYLANDSENLDYQNPLATQVPIKSGTTTVTIPSDSLFRTNYTIVVIGDSGDASPTFTIVPVPSVASQ